MQLEVEAQAPSAPAALESARAQRLPVAAAVGLITIFGVSIFASAFLLFLVEPMIAKMILPLAGGTPAVWTTSVLFFQSVLLVGYGYSHWLAMRLPWRWQAILHGALLLSPVPLLPIHLIPGWTPPDSNPIGWLVLVLAVAVGLPFLVLSTTSPLVQHWFSRTGHPQAHDPYFLYRASNLGSALGLLSYPFVIEPLIGLKDQAQLWRAGYVAFLILIAAAMISVARARATAPVIESAAVSGEEKPITWRRRARWILLAAVPSTWMLAVTSYFTTVVRPMPLLWVIPLTLYLLSFVVVFARRPLIPRTWLNRLFPFYALPLLGMVLLGGGGPFWFLAALHFGAFFLAALLCHGELATDRPGASHVTEFYWWLGVGGAVGGLFVAVIGPQAFKDFWEYPIAIAGAALLRPALVSAADRRSRIADFALPAAMGVILLVVAGAMSASGWLDRLNRMDVTNAATGADLIRVLIVFAIPAVIAGAFTRRPARFGLAMTAMFLLGLLPIGSQAALYQQRDFFGVHKVVSDPTGTKHALVDGGTIHGLELMTASGRDAPTSYYSTSGPVGDFFKAEDPVDETWNVAVIGLGAGGMACYARTRQNWTFYEIDPVVVRIARDSSLFTFLNDCTPQASVVLGDGRLTIGQAPDHSYNLIVLDAFGSDAIPIHLLTREALQLYTRKLAPDGVLLFNVSNRYVGLAPILATEAASLSMVSYERIDTKVTTAQAAEGKFPSDWVAMAWSRDALADLASQPGWRSLQADPQEPLWTDDFNDVLSVTRLG
ncbi:MAG TPA: fused MFS/spermidine synthase [Candidatus Dormibacteraeota bacterium]|nr:fused MFS/spermidine synthase [Candidatus Dormibacteraeota bacterium]